MARPKAPMRDKRLFATLLFRLVKRRFGGDFNKLAQTLKVSRSTIQTWASLASNKVPMEENLYKLAELDAGENSSARKRIVDQWRAAVELTTAEVSRFGQGTLLSELAGPLYDLGLDERLDIRSNKRWAVACRATQEAVQFDIHRRLTERQGSSPNILFFVWRSMRDEISERLRNPQFSSYLASLPENVRVVGFVYGRNIAQESVLKGLSEDVNSYIQPLREPLNGGKPFFSLLRLADGVTLEGADLIMDLWAVLVPSDDVTAAWLVTSPDPMLELTAGEWGVEKPWNYSASSMRLLARKRAVLSQLGLDYIDWDEKNLPNWTLVYGEKGY